MPDIPQAPVPGEGAQVGPLPTPYNQNRSTPEDFGAGAARTVERTTQFAEGLATRAKEVADFGVVSAADAAIVKTQTQLLHDNTIGEDGKPKGYLFAQGHDAQARLQPTLDQLQETVKAQVAAANNPQQQMAIQRRGQMALDEMHRQVTIHAGQQMDALNMASIRERNNVGADAAVSNAYNETARTQAITQTTGYLMGLANLQGDPTDSAGRVRGWQKQVAIQIAQRMLVNGRGDLAAKFLDQPLLPPNAAQKEQIAQVVPPEGPPTEEQQAAVRKITPSVRDLLGKDGDEIQHQVAQVVIAQQAQRIVRDIVRTSRRPSGEMDFTTLKDKIGAMPTDTPEQIQLKTHVDALARHQAVEMHKAWRQQTNDAYVAAAQASRIDEEGNGEGRIDIDIGEATDPMAMARFKRLDPKGYEAMRAKSLSDDRVTRRMDTVEAAAVARRTQRDAFNNIDRLFATEQGQKRVLALGDSGFARLEIEQSGIGGGQQPLAPGEFARLLARYEKLKRIGAGKDVSLTRLTDMARDRLGLGQKTMHQLSKGQLDNVLSLARAVEEDPEYKDLSLQNKGQTLRRDDLGKIVDRLTLQRPKPGSGWFGSDFMQEKPADFELPPSQRQQPPTTPARPGTPQKKAPPVVPDHIKAQLRPGERLGFDGVKFQAFGKDEQMPSGVSEVP